MAEKKMTHINQEWLQKLSTEQIHQAGMMLETIFVHKKTIGLMDHKRIQLMAILIQSVDLLTMKKTLFHSLSDQHKLEVFCELNPDNQAQLLEESPLGQKCIILLSEKQKQDLLDTVSNQELKDMISNQQNQVKTKEGKRSLHHCIQECLIIIQSPAKPLVEIKKVFERWPLDQFSEEELQETCQSLVAEFAVLKLPLQNQDQFLMYLKFFQICSLFHTVYPKMISLIEAQIDCLIVALYKMPNDEWLTKIITPIPSLIIFQMVHLLKRFPQIAHFDKKTIYSKLLKRVVELAKNTKSKKLIQAFQNEATP